MIDHFLLKINDNLCNQFSEYKNQMICSKVFLLNKLRLFKLDNY